MRLTIKELPGKLKEQIKVFTRSSTTSTVPSSSSAPTTSSSAPTASAESAEYETDAHGSFVVPFRKHLAGSSMISTALVLENSRSKRRTHIIDGVSLVDFGTVLIKYHYALEARPANETWPEDALLARDKTPWVEGFLNREGRLEVRALKVSTYADSLWVVEQHAETGEWGVVRGLRTTVSHHDPESEATVESFAPGAVLHLTGGLTPYVTEHKTVICDGCRCFGLMGVRWHCVDCNWDVCGACYSTGVTGEEEMHRDWHKVVLTDRVLHDASGQNSFIRGSLWESMATSMLYYHDWPAFGEFHEETQQYKYNTWGEVMRQVQLLSTGLERILPPGERQATLPEVLQGRAQRARRQDFEKENRWFVGILCPNSVEWSVIDSACMRQRLVSVPIHVQLVPDQQVHILQASGAQVLFTTLILWQRLTDAVPHPPALRWVVFVDNPPTLPSSPALHFLRWDALLAGEENTPPVPPRRALPTDLITIVFTSGSTGMPKGTPYRDSDILRELSIYQPRMFVSAPFTSLVVAPFAYVTERNKLHMSQMHGGQLALFSSPMDQYIPHLRIAHPTRVVAVPSLWNLLWEEYQSLRVECAKTLSPVEADARALLEAQRFLGERVTVLSMGGAPVAPHILNWVRETFHWTRVREGYGSTEASGMLNDHSPLPGVVMVLEPRPDLGYGAGGGGGCAPPMGEIVVRTAFQAEGYWRAEDVSDATWTPEGFIRTGDIGLLVTTKVAQACAAHAAGEAVSDPDLAALVTRLPEKLQVGDVVVVDRVKSLFKLTNGEWVSPAQVERVLTGIPAIAQLWVTSDSSHEHLAAVIVPHREAFEAVLGSETQSQQQWADVLKSALARRVMREMIQSMAETGALRGVEVPKRLLLVGERFTSENGLLNSNGKIHRVALHSRFGAELDAATPSEVGAAPRSALEELLHNFHLDSLLEASSTTEDLTAMGMDSVVAAVLSQKLASLGVTLTASILLAPGGANYLRQVITTGRAHAVPADADAPPADLWTRSFPDWDAVDSMATGTAVKGFRPLEKGDVVFVTGGTGFIGAHLIGQLLQGTRARVVALVRGEEGRLSRVAKHYRVEGWDEARVEVVSGDLAQPRLGMSKEAYTRVLGLPVAFILHCGAEVNWMQGYHALEATNVGATQEVVTLALKCGRAPVCFISTLSAVGPVGGEREWPKPGGAPPPRQGGYGQSKWAAEVVMTRAAAERGLPVQVVRPGLIVGHQGTGATNHKDFFGRLITTLASEAASAPPSEVKALTWLPVDVLASLVVFLCQEGTSTTGLVSPVELPGSHALSYSHLAAALTVPLAASWEAWLQALPAQTAIAPLLESLATPPRFRDGHSAPPLLPASFSWPDLAALTTMVQRARDFLTTNTP